MDEPDWTMNMADTESMPVEPGHTETTTELDAVATPRAGKGWTRVAVVVAVILFAGLVASNVMLWLRAEDAKSDLRIVRREATHVTDVSCNPFESDKPTFCDDVEDAGDRADEAYDHADEAFANVENTRDCINTYMETIARWSSNVNSRYTYRRC